MKFVWPQHYPLVQDVELLQFGEYLAKYYVEKGIEPFGVVETYIRGNILSIVDVGGGTYNLEIRDYRGNDIFFADRNN